MLLVTWSTPHLSFISLVGLVNCSFPGVPSDTLEHSSLQLDLSPTVLAIPCSGSFCEGKKAAHCLELIALQEGT